MATLSKQVQIANRSYPVTVDSSEEAKVRAAQALIGEKLFVYESKYPGRDYQDLLAMTSLQLALEMQNLSGVSSKTNAHDRSLSELTEIEQLLDKTLG